METTKPKTKEQTELKEFEKFVKMKLPSFQFDLLTEILGISTRMLTAYFNDPLKISLPVFFKLSEVLEMTCDELKEIINPKTKTDAGF